MTLLAGLPVDVTTTPLLTDWVTAVGTVGAVIVALVLGIREQRRGHREAQARHEESIRAQASQVGAWEIVEYDREVVNEQGETTIIGHNRRIVLQNNSRSPIYNVEIATYWTPGSLYRWEIPMVIPGGEPESHWLPGDLDAPDFRITAVAFTDAAGRRWRRDKAGALSLLDDGAK